MKNTKNSQIIHKISDTDKRHPVRFSLHRDKKEYNSIAASSLRLSFSRKKFKLECQDKINSLLKFEFPGPPTSAAASSPCPNPYRILSYGLTGYRLHI